MVDQRFGGHIVWTILKRGMLTAYGSYSGIFSSPLGYCLHTSRVFGNVFSIDLLITHPKTQLQSVDKISTVILFVN